MLVSADRQSSTIEIDIATRIDLCDKDFGFRILEWWVVGAMGSIIVSDIDKTPNHGRADDCFSPDPWHGVHFVYS